MSRGSAANIEGSTSIIWGVKDGADRLEASSKRGAELNRFLMTGELPTGVTTIPPFPRILLAGRFIVGNKFLILATIDIKQVSKWNDMYRLGFDVAESITTDKLEQDIPWRVIESVGDVKSADFTYDVVTQFPLGWQMNDLARTFTGESGIRMPFFGSSRLIRSKGRI